MRQPIKYGRVSTVSGEQLSALETQVSWLNAQPGDLLLTDVETGKSLTRKGYTKLKEMVAAGLASEVIVTHFSRLGRDGKEAIGFVELCDANATVVRARDDGILTCSTPDGKTLVYIKAGMAESESDVISRRVRGARTQGKADRKPMKKPCWGYRLSEDRKRLELREPDATTARALIEQLKRNNWRMMPTLKAFEGRVPLHSVRALRSWLLNPTIRGGLAYDQQKNHQFREVYWDQHPALLSHEDFAAMEVIMRRNRLLWGRHGSRTVRRLTGLLVCGECGRRLKYVTGRVHQALRCSGEGCSQLYRSIREEVVCDALVEVISGKAAAKLAAAVEQPESPEVQKLRAEISRYEALCDPDLADVIATKKARLTGLISKPAIDEDLIKDLADPMVWSTLDEAETVSLFQLVVEQVTVSKQEVAEVRLRL